MRRTIALCVPPGPGAKRIRYRHGSKVPIADIEPRPAMRGRRASPITPSNISGYSRLYILINS
jgi:hypothetical protein